MIFFSVLGIVTSRRSEFDSLLGLKFADSHDNDLKIFLETLTAHIFNLSIFLFII